MKDKTLLKVSNLKTYYITEDETIYAVDGVNFQVGKGELVGIAGESGCGKTTVANSIMRILPPIAKIKGEIFLGGQDITKLSEQKMRKVRWNEISIVFQNAQAALNPTKTIGEQIAEPLIWHRNYLKTKALQRARELLELVRVDPERAKNFPHQLSGGMKQRAVIAMALACEPKILIADEPTTALDVMVQAQILELLKELQQEYSLSLLYISHDLSVLAELCQRIIIMYAGVVVEVAPTEEIFSRPYHPYTEKLMRAIPTLDIKERLETIPGSPPRLVDPPKGCRFYERCGYGKAICNKSAPALVEVAEDHLVACFKYGNGKISQDQQS
jgi:peptide/nickel transport system ATP-binding protein